MLDAGLQKGVGIYPGEGWCMPWCPHAKVPSLSQFFASGNLARKSILLLNTAEGDVKRWKLKSMSRKCNRCIPQWHVESANGLMDLMLLADNVFKLTA